MDRDDGHSHPPSLLADLTSPFTAGEAGGGWRNNGLGDSRDSQTRSKPHPSSNPQALP